MIVLLKILSKTVLNLYRSYQQLAFEIILLRYQLNILQRNTKTPHLKTSDRALFVFISRVLQLETVFESSEFLNKRIAVKISQSY